MIIRGSVAPDSALDQGVEFPLVQSGNARPGSREKGKAQMSESKEPQAAEPPSRDPMYRAVVALLISDVVVGLGLAIFAAAVLDTRPIAFLGLAMALLGIAILAFYVAIGARADRRAKVAKMESTRPNQ